MSNRIRKSTPPTAQSRLAKQLAARGSKPIPRAEFNKALGALGLVLLLAIIVAGISVWIILRKH